MASLWVGSCVKPTSFVKRETLKMGHRVAHMDADLL
jgi:hypothetical protein